MRALVICAIIFSSNFVHACKGDGTAEFPLLQFSVMSDIHIKEGDPIAQIRFLKALRDHRNINPNSSILILNGDLTNGQNKNYKRLEKLLRKVQHAPVHATIGNHEYYQIWKYEHAGLRLNPHWTSEKAKELFQNRFGYKKPYHDLWLDDYHFIFLGSEQYRDFDKSVQEDAYLSQKQLNWLARRLEENSITPYSKTKKPIFVFLHQPLVQSLDGSENARGVIQHKELRQLLRNYPHVLLFSGHTHLDLENTKQMAFDNFHIIGTGSIRQVREQHFVPTHKSESLIVEVYNNRIVIKKREHISKRWIYPHETIYLK
ncbi:metallophosphoesterase family protein [Paenibacillus sp. sgz302251]|uniref:metallophosphoesterase family protein n=1 Tax=Paenibacillus sp. sgz302251 TaxID=3414493 RepID=UPI003C7A0777